METEKSIRRRTLIKVLAAGNKTWECSLETVNYTEDEHLVEQDSLVAQLEKRCKGVDGDKSILR